MSSNSVVKCEAEVQAWCAESLNRTTLKSIKWKLVHLRSSIARDILYTFALRTSRFLPLRYEMVYFSGSPPANEVTIIEMVLVTKNDNA